MISIRKNDIEDPARRHSKAPLLFTLMLMFTMAVAGCSSSTTDPGETNDDDNNTTDPPAANSVAMEGLSFVPGDLTVQVGTTVTWTNESNVIHTVTSGTNGTHDGEFNSGDIGPDEEYSYTFDEEGSFPYYCIPHVNQGMTGTITVEAAD